MALLRHVLTPARPSIPALSRQLRWTHTRLEHVVTTRWDALGRAGMRLHLAPKDVANGPRWTYVDVNGQRGSTIRRAAPASIGTERKSGCSS